jgi:hypothetical protein
MSPAFPVKRRTIVKPENRKMSAFDPSVTGSFGGRAALEASYLEALPVGTSARALGLRVLAIFSAVRIR